MLRSFRFPEFLLAKQVPILLCFLLVAIASFFAGRMTAPTSVVVADAYITADAANFAQCRGELGQYMALANKLFYEAAGGPHQVYWEDPYLYLPNDARTCNATADPIACARTQPGTFIFRLQTIFDGTPALVPVRSIPDPPPPVVNTHAI